MLAVTVSLLRCTTAAAAASAAAAAAATTTNESHKESLRQDTKEARCSNVKTV